MTGNFSVDTEALDRLADQVRQAAVEARAVTTDSGSLQRSVAALGAPGLMLAVRQFFENWNAALAGSVSDAYRLADAIAVVSRGYQDAESVSTRMMSR